MNVSIIPAGVCFCLPYYMELLCQHGQERNHLKAETQGKETSLGTPQPFPRN